MIINNNEEKDITKILKSKRYCEFPIHTYYNESIGNKFFIDGIL